MSSVYTGDLLSARGVKAWRGVERTNGFLMRNADGRVAAITQAGVIDMSLNPITRSAVPYGNGLVRFFDDVQTPQGANQLRSGQGANLSVGQFAGVVKYEPAWASSHPVQNWGIPAYSKFTAITRGIVGYKFSQKMNNAVQPVSDPNYLNFLAGDGSQLAAVDTFSDWMDALAAAQVQGSNLYLCFSLATGFPKVIVGGPIRDAIAVATIGLGYVLVGQAVVIEPENEMIGFELDGHIIYGG